jgi:hypothetical protein
MTSNTAPRGLAGLGKSVQQHFSHVIDGIYGTFATPAGRICYMQTKARIGDGASSKHAQLTASLVPAREALSIQEMDFNELLQRDLDDHRIATKLIPYILNPPANTLPGFFPPIVAVLLPFDHHQQPIERFEPPGETVVDLDHQYGGHFKMTTHGRAYRVQFLSDDKGNLAELPLAVLRWNSDEAKLVIMDGQHRAMSLLAIERTVSKSWHTAPKGARYQPFYEEHVQRWLRKARDEGHPVDLSNIELPVTICWLPEEPGEAARPRPHRAARKLFVDVNNTAKPPSEARLVLLSDTGLRNIFARELLNRLRSDARWEGRLPLYGVEYDDAGTASAKPTRWSAVTNLEILKSSIVRVLFQPDTLDVSVEPLHKQPKLWIKDRLMGKDSDPGKTSLRRIEDGHGWLFRCGVDDGKFPMEEAARHKLLDAFYDDWGYGILWLLSNVFPYQAHLRALGQRRDDWHAVTEIQLLAKSALFDDPSMYRALARGCSEWLAMVGGTHTPSPLWRRPAYLEAWDLLQNEERTEFGRLRSKLYLGSDSVEAREHSDAMFDRLISLPAQVGLVLAWAFLVERAGRGIKPHLIAESLAQTVNFSLSASATCAENRSKLFLQVSRGLDACADVDAQTLEISRFFDAWIQLSVNPETFRLWRDAGLHDIASARYLG